MYAYYVCILMWLFAVTLFKVDASGVCVCLCVKREKKEKAKQ